MKCRIMTMSQGQSNYRQLFGWLAIGLMITLVGFIGLYLLTHDTHGMEIGEYGSKAFVSWFMGFFPAFEIYGAVPVSYLLGLGMISSVVWAVYGNLVPIWVIHYGYEYLNKHPRIGKWLRRLSSEKIQARMNRYGVWAVLILTPWVGVWAMTITARILGMTIERLFIFATISIVSYAVVIALTMDVGAKVITGG